MPIWWRWVRYYCGRSWKWRGLARMVAGVPPHAALCLVPLALCSLQKSYHCSLVSPTCHHPPFLGCCQAAKRALRLGLGSQPGHGSHPIAPFPQSPHLSSGKPLSPLSPPLCPELLCGRPKGSYTPDLNQGRAARDPGFHG